MELDEALAEITKLQGTIAEQNITIEQHQTEKANFTEKETKLNTEVTRLQQRNLDFFNRLEEQRLDTINTGGQPPQPQPTEETTMSLEDVVEAFM